MLGDAWEYDLQRNAFTYLGDIPGETGQGVERVC